MSNHIRIILFSFSLCIGSHLIAGDDPCSSTDLSLSSSFISYDNLGNSESGIEAPPHGDYMSPDFWFSFTMSGGGSLFLAIEPGSLENPALAVYQGPCSDLKLLYNVIDNNCDQSEGPTIEFTDLTPGEEYFIRIWPEGNSANGSFSVYFNDAATVTPEFNVFGDASFSGDCILLTEETNTQNGCAWFEEAIDFTVPFTHTMTANFGDKNASGADGICLVYQNASASYCGISGGGIGALGMPNSAIFEFDTWENDIYDDPVQDHAAFNVNGDMNHNNSIDGPITLGNIEDGNDHEIIFTWDPSGDNYELFFDGALILSGSYDIINNCFGGNSTAYWGYTSATGGSNNNHLICPIVVEYEFGTQEYVEEVICEDESFQGYSEEGFFIDIAGGSNCAHQENLYLIVLESSIDLLGPYHIDCNNPEIKLLSEIGVKNEHPDYPIDYIEYQWTGPFGISGNQERFDTNVDGYYCLTAIISFLNTSHTCLIEECIDVTIDTMSPEIQTIEDLIVDCNSNPEDEILDASNSIGNALTFDWYLNGVPISSEPFVYTSDFGEGTYELIIQDQINGCTDNAFSIVTYDFETPDISFGPIDTLSCNIEEIIITAGISNGDSENHDFVWLDPQGNDLFQNEDFFTVSSPGVYSLTAVSPNGCNSQEFIEVHIDTIHPDIEISSSGVLDCQNTFVELSGNSQSSISSYLWSNNYTTPMTTVSSAGTYFLEIESENGCTNRDSIEIVVEGIEFSFQLGDSILTCGTSSFVFEPVIDGNYESLNWQLSDGTMTNQSAITVDAQGDYILEVVDENNCILTDTLHITLDTQEPSYSYTLDSISCIDQGVITVETDIENSLSWIINGETIEDSLEIFSNSVVDAILFLTGANGCVTTDTLSFFSNESVPDFSVSSNNINCDNPQAVLEVSSTDIVNVEWEGPGNFTSTNSQIVVEEVGAYFLRVADNEGCEILDTLLITIDTIAPPLQIDFSSIDCSDRESIVSVIDPESFFEYSYDIGNGPMFQNSFVTSDAVAGIYTSVNPVNGCRSNSPFEITVDTLQPETEFIFNDINCENLQSELSIINPQSDFMYEWILSDSESTEPMLVTNQGGPVSLVTLNTLNGCVDTSFFEILIDTIAPDPEIELIQMGCNIDQAQISITNDIGNWATQWFYDNELIDESVSSITTSLAGEYEIRITDTNNFCNTTLQATIESYIPLTAEIETIDPSCIINTGSLSIESVIGGVPDYQWSITDGDSFTQESIIQGLDAGNYTLLIEDDQSCQIELPFNIAESTPLSIDLIDSLVLDGSLEINVTPVLNVDESEVAFIEWSPADILSCTDCLNPNYLIFTDSTLTLSVTDINGCMDSDQIHISPPIFTSIYIPNIFSPHNNDGNNDRFFPFANRGVVKEVTLMDIYDRWENRVFRNENFPIGESDYGWDGTFNNQHLNPAVFTYFIKGVFINEEEFMFTGNVTLVD